MSICKSRVHSGFQLKSLGVSLSIFDLRAGWAPTDAGTDAATPALVALTTALFSTARAGSQFGDWPHSAFTTAAR